MSCILSAKSKILVFNCVDGMLQIVLGQEKPQYIYSVQLKEGASAILLPEIQKGLNILDWRVNELTKIACTVGPGSFTGIRISLATLLGLSSQTISCVGLNLLQILAAGACEATEAAELWVLQYARRNTVAIQGFVRQNFQAIAEPSCVPLEQAAAILQTKQSFAVLGTGLRKNLGFFESRISSQSFISSQYDIASCEKLWQEACLQDFAVEPPVPLYLREADVLKA